MGQVPLELATCIEPVYKYKKFDLVFKIVTPSRTYYINCASEDDMKDWINTLREVSQKVNISIDKTHEKETNLNDFEILSLIGKGAYGKIFLVRMKETQELFAMKVIPKKQVIEEDSVEQTLAEKNILSRVRMPFLVNLYYSFQTPSNLHYVIDYCSGGSLYSYMQKEKVLTEEQAKFYAAQMVLALEHLHGQNIIYRDVKPENISICSDGYIRLTDFGLSKENIAEDSTTSTFCGTPEYLAPELIQSLPYTNNIDWWGLGVLIYEMINGNVPFFNDNIQKLYHKILYDPIPFPEKCTYSDECKDIIENLLQKLPENRLSDPRTIKQHAWFSSINFDSLFKKELEPSYIPDLESPTDLKYFDSTITSEKLDMDGEAVETSAFGEFTYSVDK